MRQLLRLVACALLLALSGCGYNALQRDDEAVKAAWSEVGNQYQRRADLVPNLVATVKGEAQFEQSTLVAVIAARSRATSLQATPQLVDDPVAFGRFQRAQGDLTGALSRLMMVAESYPTLRANQGFLDLQAQLEGTENRIAVARNRYIEAVRDYNVLVRSFPSNLTARAVGMHEKATFEADPPAMARPPRIDFGSPASAASAGER